MWRPVAVVLLLVLIGAMAGTPETKEVAVPGPTVAVTVTATVTVTAPAPSATAPAPSQAPGGTGQSAGAGSAASGKATLPNFVGQQLQAAQDGAQAAGFFLLSSEDATGAARLQVLDRNWKVCGQNPGPGAQDATTRVTFSVVKTEESCP